MEIEDESTPKGLFQAPSIEININPPQVGTEVTAIGFTCEKIKTQPNVLISLPAYISSGSVREVYPISRDSGFANFPCFSVDTPFNPGMSGGPIFDEKNALCEIICTGSLGFFEEELSQNHSLGSTLWPMLSTVIQRKKYGSEEIETYFLRELAETGKIFCKDWRKVEVSLNPETGGTNVCFSPDRSGLR